jgi:hypothetical protein
MGMPCSFYSSSFYRVRTEYHWAYYHKKNVKDEMSQDKMPLRTKCMLQLSEKLVYFVGGTSIIEISEKRVYFVGGMGVILLSEKWVHFVGDTGII